MGFDSALSIALPELVLAGGALLLLVLGGAGKHSMVIPSFGITTHVTRALTLPNGKPARSIEDYRRA